MGSCVSVHKSSQESAMKLGFSFGSKTDANIIVPLSPVKEEPFAIGDFALIPQPPCTFKDFGSKEETFFDSQAYLDSDREDDFFSVNGDFTPSRGNTPVHHSFSVVSPRVSKASMEGSHMPFPETSHTVKKKKLIELFRESVREDQDQDLVPSMSTDGTPYHVSGANSLCSSEWTANGDNPMFKEKPFKSMQCCLLPSFVSCSSFNERKKKKMSPAIAVNDRP